MCQTGNLAVCVCFFCLFHCLPVFSLHFLCALSSGVSQPFLIHFWDLQPILPHHPCTISIPPSSLSWFSLSSKLNCWLFTVRYKWSSHITAIWCFFDNLVQDFYLYLIFFLHNSSNYFFNTSALAFLCCLFLSPSFSSPSPVLLARSPDRCGSLCGTNRPEAEGCLCPFRLITSHLCVHKQTNTTINLRAQYRLRGWGRGRGREAKRW